MRKDCKFTVGTQFLIITKSEITNLANRHHHFTVYPRGQAHNPPHFHVKYGDYKAEVDLRTLQILVGELPKRAKSLVMEWADEHRDELAQDWELARQMQELRAIEPLK